MAEKPAASTMPPPSATRPISPAPEAAAVYTSELRELQDVVAELGALAQESSVETDDPVAAWKRAAKLTGEAIWWIRKVAEAAVSPRPARAGYPIAEEAAIGVYEPTPRYDRYDEASTASLLVQCLAPNCPDEPIADGLEQLAADLVVFGHALGGDSRISTDILHRAVTGYEHRVRVLSGIARKTLRASGRAA